MNLKFYRTKKKQLMIIKNTYLMINDKTCVINQGDSTLQCRTYSEDL